jgi:hypothetical protein
MASINGVEVKNVKEIKNNSFEWGSILTGVIYLNGKKLGEWSQDPHGAVCDNFDAGVEKALMPAVLGVKSTKTGIEADIYDASCLIADIVLLKDREKRYKGYLSKGYPVVLVASEKSTGIEVYQAFKEGAYITEKRKEEFVLEFVKTLHSKGYSNASIENIEVFVYRTPDDFKQTIGTSDSIKKELDKQEKERKAAQKKANDEKKQRELKEKDREKRNNGRFVATETNGNPSMCITDTKTGKKVLVPLYAFKETYNAIIDLMC